MRFEEVTALRVREGAVNLRSMRGAKVVGKDQEANMRSRF